MNIYNGLQIDRIAFRGLKLRKLFLDNNELYYLPDGIFEDFNSYDLISVDLTSIHPFQRKIYLGNNWQCVCTDGQEWLADWLISIGDANSYEKGDLGCLIERCLNSKLQQPHPRWMTYAAVIFSTFTVFCIMIIGVLLVQDLRRRNALTEINRNHTNDVTSDRACLITDKFSFPNPTAILDNVNIEETSSVELIGTSLKNGHSTTKKKVRFDNS